ncbi:MAG: aldo/keto reductase [Planctomycetota bacterium]|jgi:predicted oxidoreductase|nr:aldo/keto reductase [Planctomycetota bacterium]
MKTIRLGKSGLQVPRLAVGCMRIDKLEKAAAESFIQACLEAGANFFDHADVYADGECEKIFANAIGMKASIRDQFILQSKCGIVKDVSFDFRKDHILRSVDASLKRLQTDYLDVLLLHRPDALVEPEEVAAAFDHLENTGKVRNFGVSNQKPMQIKLLQKFVRQPIAANQLQLSIAYATLISQGLHVNMQDERSFDHDGSVLDFCRLEDITVQPWSPFQFGFFQGVFLDNPKFPKLNAAVDALAAKYQVSNVTIAFAWLLRHPAKMQPVTGTMNIQRIKDCIKAETIELSHEDWYKIYLGAGNILP